MHTFAFYFTKSTSFMDWLSISVIESTIGNLNGQKYANIPIPLPPLTEQRAIAAFLDRETAQIDALVEAKERMIALLHEKRGALISHVVTRGLNPDVPLRDSGVAWLGQVPAHWKVKRLKYIAEIRYGLSQPLDEIGGGLPFIRATDIKRGKIDDKEMMYVNPEHIPQGKNAILKVGEIIVVRSGAYTGDSAIVTPKYAGAIVGYDMVVTIKIGISAFFAKVFLSYGVLNVQFDVHRLRAAQPHLNAEELKETIIAVPSPLEQQAIADYLDREMAQIDTLIGSIQIGIERLRKYRAALITAAVTGEIDVRDEGQRE